MENSQFLHIDNLFLCWDEFRKEKQKKRDVLEFERHLEDNIFELHRQLENQAYRHGPYITFHIWDPKHRVISKATVRDRLVHHLIFNELYRIFDPKFIYHSYASRLDKGTHLAVNNLAIALRKVSRNNSRNVFALKCDIYKFFYSVSHQKLLQIIKNKISDKHFLWLIEEVVKSFVVDNFSRERERVTGLPIGNLSSQIFANIYLNELDQFIKHRLHARHYFRYADDFIILSSNKHELINQCATIQHLLQQELQLSLHPDKVSIRKFGQGIDSLGYIILPHHIVLRNKTKRRMFRKIALARNKFEAGQLSQGSFIQTIQSYLGMLTHCNGHGLEQDLLQLVFDREYFERTGTAVIPER